MQQQRDKAETCRQKTKEKKSQKSQDRGIMVKKYVLENGSDLYSWINSRQLYVAQITIITQPKSAAPAAQLRAHVVI